MILNTTIAGRRKTKAQEKKAVNDELAKFIYLNITRMPNSYRSPWLISWRCNEKDDTIDNISFQFCNLHKIGDAAEDEEEESKMELQVMNRLSKILIQKK